MGDRRRLSKSDWEALLHAPFHVYAVVAAVDGEPVEAQFRRLREEIEAAPGAFGDGTIGREMGDALAGSLDVLWDGYHAADRSPRDGLKRAAKVLKKKATEVEASAVIDWLVGLAVHVAEASRTVGEPTISLGEMNAIRDVAGWLDRPAPTSGQG
jgi:hypothetical protein